MCKYKIISYYSVKKITQWKINIKETKSLFFIIRWRYFVYKNSVITDIKFFLLMKQTTQRKTADSAITVVTALILDF